MSDSDRARWIFLALGTGGGAISAAVVFGVFGRWAGLTQAIPLPWIVAGGALVGGLTGYQKTKREMREHGDRHRAVERLGGGGQRDQGFRQDLEDTCRELFPVRGFLSLDELTPLKADQELTVDVFDLERTEGSDSNGRTSRETVVLFRPKSVAWPDLSVIPRRGLDKFFGALLAASEISLDDEDFNAAYRVLSLYPDVARRLLTPEVRAGFLKDRDLAAVARGKNLAVYRPGVRCAAEEVEPFVARANSLALRLIRSGQAAPFDVKREPTPRAVAEAEREYGVTPVELEEFIAQTSPRRVPSKIRRRVIGSGNAFALSAGTIFGVVGAGLASGGYLDDSAGLLAFGTLLAVCGLGMLALGLAHRRRWLGLLRRGRVAPGHIEAVERTNTVVNGERKYLASLRFEAEGRERVVRSAIYGAAGPRAQACADEGLEVKILYAEERPDRVLWAESLVLTVE